jgi:putative N6-adenine-specific DNA methylase
MFDYQRNSRFFAQVAEEIKDLGVEELTELNAKNISPVYRGIYFDADKSTLYAVNYHCRYLTRILAPLLAFHCHDTAYLYKKAKNVNWGELFTPDHSLAITATVSHSRITHSRYAALKLKDAIVDHFMEARSKRPRIDTMHPDIRLDLHIEQNLATISWDASGGSLHRRGYRKESIEAPIQETVAAAIIGLSKWDGSQALYDPMCGSGTLLIESMMRYCRIPAGFLRQRFGFEMLPDFDQALWLKTKHASDENIKSLPIGIISGSDISATAVDAARKNASVFRQGRNVKLRAMDFREIESLTTTIVCNPPYGVRLGSKDEAAELYKQFGDFLKQRCKGSTAYIYFGDRKMIPQLGLKPAWKKPLKNGGLDGRLVKFGIY